MVLLYQIKPEKPLDLLLIMNRFVKIAQSMWIRAYKFYYFDMFSVLAKLSSNLLPYQHGSSLNDRQHALYAHHNHPFGIYMSRIQTQKECFCKFLACGFSTYSSTGTWLPRTPPRLWKGVWGLLLFSWYEDLGAIYRHDATSSRMTFCLLQNTTFCTVLLFIFMLCRLSSRRINLSSTAYGFCCQIMLYILFNNSSAPCTLRLACNN